MSQENLTNLSGYIHERNILCGLELVECRAVIELLAKRLHESEGGFDCDEVVKACMDCERGAPALLAPGLALPHARVEKHSRTGVRFFQWFSCRGALGARGVFHRVDSPDAASPVHAGDGRRHGHRRALTPQARDKGG